VTTADRECGCIGPTAHHQRSHSQLMLLGGSSGTALAASCTHYHGVPLAAPTAAVLRSCCTAAPAAAPESASSDAAVVGAAAASAYHAMNPINAVRTDASAANVLLPAACRFRGVVSATHWARPSPPLLPLPVRVSPLTAGMEEVLTEPRSLLQSGSPQSAVSTTRCRCPATGDGGSMRMRWLIGGPTTERDRVLQPTKGLHWTDHNFVCLVATRLPIHADV
jgi:hypothetical protein